MNDSHPSLYSLKAGIFRRSWLRRHEGGPKHLRVEVPARANKSNLAYLPVGVSPSSPSSPPFFLRRSLSVAPSQLPWLPSRSARTLPSGPSLARCALPQLGPALVGLILLVAFYRAGGYSGDVFIRARGAPHAAIGRTAEDMSRIPRPQSLRGLLVTIPSRSTRFGT